VAPALLPVRVQPRASRDEIAGWQGDALRVRVAAAPADGLANRAVAALLAAAARVPLSSVALVRGARGRDKLFRVGGLSLGDLRSRLPGPAAGPAAPAPAVRAARRAGRRGGRP
jgi:uncharacterized protein (TIGR00251 family)